MMVVVVADASVDIDEVAKERRQPERLVVAGVGSTHLPSGQTRQRQAFGRTVRRLHQIEGGVAANARLVDVGAGGSKHSGDVAGYVAVAPPGGDGDVEGAAALAVAGVKSSAVGGDESSAHRRRRKDA